MLWSDTHRLFLQGLMANATFTSDELKAFYRTCATAAGAIAVNGTFDSFLVSVRQEIEPLGMDVATGTRQDSGEQIHGLINTKEDPVAEKGTTRSKAELAFFKALIEYLVTSETGSIRNDDAFEIALNLKEVKVSTGAAEKALEDFKEQGWLSYVTKEQFYILGPRSLLELRRYMQATYGSENMKPCAVCKDTVFFGAVCPADCGAVAHVFCLPKLFNLGHKHCPSCKEEWDAPLYDVSDVEGGGLSDHTGDATTVLDVEDDDE